MRSPVVFAAVLLLVTLLFAWVGLLYRDLMGRESSSSNSITNPLAFNASVTSDSIITYINEGKLVIRVYAPPCTDSIVRVYRVGDGKIVGEWEVGGGSVKVLTAELKLPGNYFIGAETRLRGEECPIVRDGSLAIYWGKSVEWRIRTIVAVCIAASAITILAASRRS